MDERHTAILKEVVRLYIQEAYPVSSRQVASRLPERISSATVRNDMLALEEDGYLRQPHVSAGRIPTADAFRFVVEQLLDDAFVKIPKERPSRRLVDVEAAARTMAHKVHAAVFVSSSSSLALAGFEFVLAAPELKDEEARGAFALLIDSVTSWHTRLLDVLDEPLEVFVAGENPLYPCEHFSIAAARVAPRSVAAIIGPLRMDYVRAIRALNDLMEAR